MTQFLSRGVPILALAALLAAVGVTPPRTPAPAPSTSAKSSRS